MDGIELILPGRMMTKKTHNQLVVVGGRPRILPSKQYRAWFQDAILQIQAVKHQANREGILLPLRGWVEVRALFYIPNLIQGDLTGYMDGLGDFLQERQVLKKPGKVPKLLRDGAGFIINDKYIASWDGSRVLLDRTNPRTEVIIRPYQNHLDLVAPEEVANES